jgi:hypothetical protein
MTIFIWSLYFVIIATFIVVSIFIAYHLKKYSLNSPLNIFLLPFFIVISVLLLFSNVLLFSSVRWDELLSAIIM